MAIIFPSSPKEIADRMRTDVKNALPTSNPFLANSYLNADIIAMSGAIFECYAQIQEVIKEIFPDTASMLFIERWASDYGFTRLAATQSSGFISVNGVPGSLIPINTLLSTQENQNYLTIGDKTIVTSNIGFEGFTFLPSTITFTTAQPHILASGIEITVSGFNEAEANGTFMVNVEDEVTFSYVATGLVSTPTGTPSVTSDIAPIQVRSESFGGLTNQRNGAVLIFGATIAGVNSSSFVQFDGLVGGADIESDESLRDRVLFRLRNPGDPFSVGKIIEKAREVQGVTRVFVQEGVGTVSVIFTQDNLENNIPSGLVVSQVREKILEIRTVGLPEDRVFVNAPTPITVNLSFQFITPDTTSMRSAIEENVRDFFRNIANLGKTIKNRELQCAIESTIDLDNGQLLDDFNLTSPAGSIPLNNDEIAVLGNITYGA